MKTNIRSEEKPTAHSTVESNNEVAMSEKALLEADVPSSRARALIIGDLALKHGLSADRAEMLVNRFGTGRAGLESAAQNLRERRTFFKQQG